MDDLLLQTLYGLLLFETPKSNKQKQRLENVPKSTRNIKDPRYQPKRGKILPLHTRYGVTKFQICILIHPSKLFMNVNKLSMQNLD